MFPLLPFTLSLLRSLLLLPLQRGVLLRMPLAPLPVRVKPLAQAVNVVAERGNLVALLFSPMCLFPLLPFTLSLLRSLLLSLLQLDMLARMPLGSLLVRVKPSAQAVDVVAERSNLVALSLPSLRYSSLHRGVLGPMSLTPLSVRIKPPAQTVYVITERGDLTALLLRSFLLPPFQRCIL